MAGSILERRKKFQKPRLFEHREMLPKQRSLSILKKNGCDYGYAVD